MNTAYAHGSTSARPGRPPQPPRPVLSGKHLLFLVLALATLFVLWNNERFLIDHAHPLWAYYQPVLRPLFPHGLAGTLVLVLGALQFSSRLRSARPRLHRISGRLYVASVAIAAPTAVYVSFLHNGVPTRVAILTQASLWLLTTALAFHCIRRRNFTAHREWMIRSYAITTIFLWDRVIDAVPAFAALDSDANPSVLWLCNVLVWVVSSVIIGWPQLTRSSARA